MGGKSSGPDYGQLAVQQGEANEGVVRNQTYANRPTQYTPWGYTEWNPYSYKDPASGEQVTRWEQTQGLTPELQKILNDQVALQGGRSELAQGMTERLANEYGQAMNYGGLNPFGRTPEAQLTLPEQLRRDVDFSGVEQVGDPTALRQRAEDAVYQKGVSRLAPQFDSRRQAMEIKLRNQGLGPEDAAYKAQMQGIDQQETDAYGQLQADAITQGLGEQAQLFGQGMGLRQQGVNELMSQAQFGNQAAGQAYNQMLGANQQNFGQGMQAANYANQLRQQQMAEMMQRRGQGLNEINALLYGQQVQMPQMPQFQSAGQAAAAPIYQAGVDQGNFDQMQSQGLYSGLGSLANFGLRAYGL